MSDIDRDVVKYLNQARTNPKSLIPFIENQLKLFINQTSYKITSTCSMQTQQGKKAWLEAIEFLNHQPPVNPVAWHDGIYKAAKFHASTCGEKGTTGHTGVDGSSVKERIQRFGHFNGWGENCSYGTEGAFQIVVVLIIDDGVKGRGHRKNIYNPDFKYSGASVCPHKSWGTICVMDFGMNEIGKEAPKVKHEDLSADISADKFKEFMKKKPDDDDEHDHMRMSSGHWKHHQSQKHVVSKSVKTTIRNGVKTVVTKIKYSDGSEEERTETTS